MSIVFKGHQTQRYYSCSCLCYVCLSIMHLTTIEIELNIHDNISRREYWCRMYVGSCAQIVNIIVANVMTKYSSWFPLRECIEPNIHHKTTSSYPQNVQRIAWTDSWTIQRVCATATMVFKANFVLVSNYTFQFV